ncbi:hypothetical protein COV82_03615 [Candidatus Peregrinibacteria bacterium CG11_big_fil_rev_8_21_14_0_20_46_8]|nr:MAG: hypothetical protein COV82_03615 [Candidatus Peregrinibacteria bacterium CG11_big_fil_rev_8_21_14_0_20_46_8]
MFGIGKLGDGEYFDSLARQFKKGGPQGNRVALVKLDTGDYQRKQWIEFLRTEHLPNIRARIILSLREKDSRLNEIFLGKCEKSIRDKAQKFAQDEMRNNPPLTLVDKRLVTLESLSEEWKKFLRTECMETIEKQVAKIIFNDLPQDFQTTIDKLAEEEILKRADREVRDQVIEQATAASRAAIILNGGLSE